MHVEWQSGSILMFDRNKVYWFVLKTVFSRELQLKAMLDERGIENFVPMCCKVKTVKGKKEIVTGPAINDLVFVYARHSTVQQFKRELFLQKGYDAYFLTRKEGQRNIIETVPQRQMQDFIRVASQVKEDIAFYKPEEIELKKGTKVRVIGGIYDKTEGVLLKVKGKRSKRIVLQIPGVAIAASYIEPELIEVIKDKT